MQAAGAGLVCADEHAPITHAWKAALDKSPSRLDTCPICSLWADDERSGSNLARLGRALTLDHHDPLTASARQGAFD